MEEGTQTQNHAIQTLELSPLDQIASPFYIRVILPIPLGDDQLSSVAHHLRQDFERTLEEIPFLSGYVAPSEQDGQVRIIMDAAGPDWSAICKTNELRTSGVDWTMSLAELRAQCFPISHLLGSALAPIPKFWDPSKPAPVFAVQINKLSGGLLLCVAFHHSALDAAGFSTVMKRWSGWCCTASGGVRLDTRGLDRTPLMTGLPPGDVNAFKEYSVSTTQEKEQVATAKESDEQSKRMVLPDMKTLILRFSVKSLRKLKEDVNLAQEQNLSSPISTNDCFCAFLWWHITRARFPELSAIPTKSSQAEDHPSKTSLNFSINGRSKCNAVLPEIYLGNVVLSRMPSFALSLLSDSTVPAMVHLATIARSIRSSISSFDAERVKRVIGLVQSLPNPTLLKPSFKSFLGPDLIITSWTTLGLNGLRFFNESPTVSESETGSGPSRENPGASGCVEAVRIPQGTYDGMCVILPWLAHGAAADSDQNVDVIVGLREEVINRLLSSSEGFCEYLSSVIS